MPRQTQPRAAERAYDAIGSGSSGPPLLAYGVVDDQPHWRRGWYWGFQPHGPLRHGRSNFLAGDKAQCRQHGGVRVDHRLTSDDRVIDAGEPYFLPLRRSKHLKFTRLSPAIDVRQNYRGVDVVATLERVAREIGYPKC